MRKVDFTQKKLEKLNWTKLEKTIINKKILLNQSLQKTVKLKLINLN